MTDALPVSVLLLVRDEVRDVEELLPTLAFAREVVVVWDARGDAAAREAAERRGARVHAHAFEGFGPQRQFALEQCTQDWVLWIDADERLAAGAPAAIAARVGAPPAHWAYTLPRRSFFLGAPIRFCGWRGERVLRLFRRRCARFDGALVHEEVHFVPPGARGADAAGEPGLPAVGALAVGLDHHSYRTREDCETKLRRYGEANAEKAYRAGRRAGALDVALRPALRFLRQYVVQLGVLDGWRGFLLCRDAARQVRLKYALLRAWSRRGGRP